MNNTYHLFNCDSAASLHGTFKRLEPDERKLSCPVLRGVVAGNGCRLLDTNAADSRNAENILIINDSELARIYKDNWNKRAKTAKQYNEATWPNISTHSKQ